MKRLNDLDYLKLNKFQAFLYMLKLFFCSIPGWFAKIGASIANFFKKFVIGIRDEFVDIFTTFTKGNWAVKLSFLIFGFGNFYYGQILRGVLFLLFEIIFIVYMFLFVPNKNAGLLIKNHKTNYKVTKYISFLAFKYSKITKNSYRKLNNKFNWHIRKVKIGYLLYLYSRNFSNDG